jgi:hypothetical protein
LNTADGVHVRAHQGSATRNWRFISRRQAANFSAARIVFARDGQVAGARGGCKQAGPLCLLGWLRQIRTSWSL